MLKASDAIVIDENFGPKEEEKEKMPALLKENSFTKTFTISLGPGPLWWS